MKANNYSLEFFIPIGDIIIIISVIANANLVDITHCILHITQYSHLIHLQVDPHKHTILLLLRYLINL